MLGAHFQEGAQSTLPGDVSTSLIASLNMTLSVYNNIKKFAIEHVYTLLTIIFISILLLRPPKLVNVKYANRLQTVSKQYQGWRGVANKGTSSASLRLGRQPTTKF